MSLYKKICGAIAVLVMVFAGAVALVRAQSGTSSIENLPEVQIRDLVLGAASYAQGSTVTGEFTLSNANSYAVSDIYYTVSLVGNYQENGLAGTFYDTQSFGPISLGANESKRVEFSYKLPETVSGKDLGIQVQAKLRNLIPLEWTDAAVSISGTNSFLTLTKAQIVVDGQDFALTAGPTVKTGSAAKVTIALKNPSDKPVQFTAIMKIGNRTDAGAPAKETKLPSMTVEPGTAKEFSMDILTVGQGAGVYIGTIDILNGSNQKIAPEINFQYIVGGQVVTINSIVTSERNLVEDQSYSVKVFYSGTPFDISGATMKESPEAKYDLKIFNENDKLVSEAKGTHKFDSGSLMNVELKASVAAKTLRALMTVTGDDGKVLATYATDLTPSSTSQVARQTASKSWMVNFYYYLIGSIAIIAVALVIYLIRRGKKKNKSSTYPYLFLLGLIGTSLFPLSAHMFAISDQKFWGDGWSTTAFTFTGVSIKIMENGSLVSVNSVGPGQQYYLAGNIVSPACSNSLQQYKPTIVIPTDANPTTNLAPVGTTPGHSFNLFRIYGTPGHNIDNYTYTGGLYLLPTTTPYVYTPSGEQMTNPSYQFSYGPYTAPTSVGSYNVFLHMVDFWADNINYPDRHGEAAGRAYGYQSLVVANQGQVQVKMETNVPNTQYAGGSSPTMEFYSPSGPRLEQYTGRSHIFSTGYRAGSYKVRVTPHWSGLTDFYPQANGTSPDYSHPKNTISVGSCTYAIGEAECTPSESSYSTTNLSVYYTSGIDAGSRTLTGVPVSDNTITKFVFRYTPVNAYGAIRIVKADSNGNALPDSVIQTWVDSQSHSTVNPNDVPGLLVGSHDVSISSNTYIDASNVSHAGFSVSKCSFNPSAAPDCNANDPLMPTAGVGEDPNRPYTVNVDVNNSQVTKVVFAYNYGGTERPTVTSCYPTPSSALVGQDVEWAAEVTGGEPTYTYAWVGEAVGGKTSNPTGIVHYNATGTKIAKLTVTDKNGVVSDQKTCELPVRIVEPVWQER